MASVFIPKEASVGETRVAATPETVKRIIKDGLSVTVEAGAGDGAHISDKQFEDAGATVVADAKSAWSSADVILKVNAPTAAPVNEAALIKTGAILVSFMAPHKNLAVVKTLAERKVSTLAMELIPRTSRAQTMDALSSQASLAGYKAVLLAATRLGKYFPLLMTAAGTIQPARVVIMGAGVAGLQAIATARRLGAIVEVSDIRPEVKEQVESLGGKFIELPTQESGSGSGGYAKEVTKEFLQKQQETVAKRVALADVVITTALVPGRPAPKLITADMVKNMREGSVIVDLAVEQGGNCELSELNQDVVKHGVLILGYSNLPSTLSEDASTMYARNVIALLALFAQKGELKLDLDDDIIAGSLLTHDGAVRHEPTRKALEVGA